MSASKAEVAATGALGIPSFAQFGAIAEPAPLTMTSREIAELTGKRHDNVLRDTRDMLNDLKLDELSFEADYLDAKGEKRIEYKLDYELTMTLLTGYSTVLRNTVIKRWKELEDAPRKAFIAGIEQFAAIQKTLNLPDVQEIAVYALISGGRSCEDALLKIQSNMLALDYIDDMTPAARWVNNLSVKAEAVDTLENCVKAFKVGLPVKGFIERLHMNMFTGPTARGFALLTKGEDYFDIVNGKPMAQLRCFPELARRVGARCHALRRGWTD